MGRSNGRTVPFPGFSRGVPIVGAKPEAPPAGRHYYQVPALIQRPEKPLEAESFEAWFPAPMNGVYFKTLEDDVRKSLGDPDAKVVLLAPVFLGFVPQEEVDRREAELGAQAQEP
jgi:hypothetical protein